MNEPPDNAQILARAEQIMSQRMAEFHARRRAFRMHVGIQMLIGEFSAFTGHALAANWTGLVPLLNGSGLAMAWIALCWLLHRYRPPISRAVVYTFAAGHTLLLGGLGAAASGGLSCPSATTMVAGGVLLGAAKRRIMGKARKGATSWKN